jgi:hypothetical protein
MMPSASPFVLLAVVACGGTVGPTASGSTGGAQTSSGGSAGGGGVLHESGGMAFGGSGGGVLHESGGMAFGGSGGGVLHESGEMAFGGSGGNSPTGGTGNGGITSGGSGGVRAGSIPCRQAYACDCLCAACETVASSCAWDNRCNDIIGCANLAHCTSLESCNQQCGLLIQGAGGPQSISARLAASVLTCAASAGCNPCQAIP